MKPLVAESFPLTGHRLIEASAGTGKTYTITSLYLRLLLGQNEYSRPLATSEILVLTFTIAATDELRERIRDRINRAKQVFSGEIQNTDDGFIQYLVENSTDVERDRKLLVNALQSMDEASVFTIHGFCARVLGEQSFETGTLFDQDLDADRDLLLQMAAEDVFRDPLLLLREPLRSIALNLWHTPEVLLQKVKPYLFRHNLSIRPAFRGIEKELQQLFDDDQHAKQTWLEDDISQVVRDCDFSGNRMPVTRLAGMDDRCRSDAFDHEMWQPYSQESLVKATKKTTVLPGHPIFKLIDSIWQRRNLIEQIPINLWHEVFNKLQENLANYKIQLGQLTLDDLLVKVHSALTGENDLLARELRSKWPVAMIDEFQDTDDLQYEIFTHIYTNPGEQGLFFIGDPKQAIYQFRGADVYTYVNARREIDTEIFSLTTNWRSTRSLVNAINHLFDQQQIFGNDEDIPFDPAIVAPPNEQRIFTIDGEITTPISLFTVAHEDGRKDSVRYLAMEYAAEQTVMLLNAAANGKALIDNKPLTAGQIAFLVRERKDAIEARAALARRNIQSVYVTQESVLASDTADDLKIILKAVANQTDEGAIKAALATPLVQTPVSEIHALNNDVITQQRVLEEFQEYHRLWSDHGIAPMLEYLISNRQIAEKWFNQPEGERQITNLRHLAELLQTRATASPGMHRLIKWFNREKQSAESVAMEDRQLRLESDQNLVQIVTMHISKGLEYDVVILPFAGFGGRKIRSSDPLLYHLAEGDNSFRTVLDISTAQDNKQKHLDEQINEDMRLLYVAITRARFKCFIGIPVFKQLAQTALARLLNLSVTDDPYPQIGLPLPEDLFDLQRVDAAGFTQYKSFDVAEVLIAPPRRPEITDTFRLHSYSSLTRILHEKGDSSSADIQPGFGDDDIVSAGIQSTQISDRFNFPRGPRVGVALHDLLEQLDFAAPRNDLQTYCRRCLDRLGLGNQEELWLQVLSDWLIDILETPMTADNGFSLADIPQHRRLNELEFFFPVNLSADFIKALRQAGYLTSDLQLSIQKLKGMMTGYIDLTVEHDGRFFLIDYKSNDLGPNVAAYNDEAILNAIRSHRYDLQYLIYTVALHRYLKQCIDGYRYEQHFGGVYYLFLRGMTGKSASGVFADRPAAALIEQLDGLLQ